MKTALVRALAALTVAAAPSLSAAQQEGGKVSVGLLLPMTGVYAKLGAEIEQGFRMGLSEFRDVGVGFDITVADTEANVAKGVAGAKTLIGDAKVDVMAGVVSSAVLANIQGLVTDEKTPLIVANAGNDHATGKDCSPYVVRVSFSNSQVNRPMGAWMHDQGVRKVYTLAPDYAAGHQQIGAFAQTFQAAGGTITGQAFTPFGKTEEFGPYIEEAWATGADAVYVFYAGGEAIKFVKQYGAEAASRARKAPGLYGSGFLTSPLYVHVQGPAAMGVTVASHYAPTIRNPSNNLFRRIWKRKFGREPSEFAVQGYDAARVLAEAVANGARGRDGIAKALRYVRFAGPRGTVEVDPKTNNVAQPVYVYQTAEGKKGPTQKILAALPLEADPVNGCALPPLE